MFNPNNPSSRFQLILLVMVLGLVGASAWFTYTAVHTSNQNTKLVDYVNQKTLKSGSESK